MRVFGSCMICVAIAATSTACTPTPTPNSIPQNQAGTVQPVQFGELIGIRPVEIRPGQTRIGAIAGAVIGGAAGSTIGNSTAANIAGGAAGATAGGAVGSALQGSQRTAGLELTVRLDSGDSVAVVQPGNPNDYRIGDRVRVIGNADNARVVR